MDAGIYIITFMSLVCFVGMGSILISILLEKDNALVPRYIEDAETPKPSKKVSMDFLNKLDDSQETYGVIIEE